MIRCTLADEEQFLALKGEWDALLEEVEDPDLFSTWEWNVAWWTNFKAGKRLFLILFRDQGGTLVGVFPGCLLVHRCFGVLKLRVIQFLGRGIEASGSIGEYGVFFDLVVHPDFRTPVYEAMMNLLGSIRGEFDLLFLEELREESTYLQFMRQHGSRLFPLSITGQEPPYYFIRLPDAFSAFEEQLTPSYRASVRRKVRKWERSNPPDLCWTNGNGELGQFFDNFMELVHRRHQKNVSRERQAYHRQLAATLSERNAFQGAYTSTTRGCAAIAVIYSYRGKFYFYQHAINPDDAEMSPGIVLLTYMIRSAIERGITRIEFLKGSEIYKKRWASHHHTVYQMTFGTGTLRSHLYFGLRRAVDAARSAAKLVLRRASHSQ